MLQFAGHITCMHGSCLCIILSLSKEERFTSLSTHLCFLLVPMHVNSPTTLILLSVSMQWPPFAVANPYVSIFFFLVMCRSLDVVERKSVGEDRSTRDANKKEAQPKEVQRKHAHQPTQPYTCNPESDKE